MSEEILEQSAPPMLTDFMGEGKKYSDSNAVAKALTEKDAFIEKLQKENELMRVDLATQNKVEDLLSPTPPAQTPVVDPVTPAVPEAPAVPAVDDNQNNVQEEVLRLIQEEKAKDTKTQNIEVVRKALTQKFGNDYNKALQAVATKLGVGTSFLADMAGKSPEGLMNLVNSIPQGDLPVTPPTSSVNTSKGITNPSVKNRAYYKQLRKTDPKLYLSKRVQSEMHSEALRQGSAFFQA